VRPVSAFMNADNRCLDWLSEKVMDPVFDVSHTLGAGFLEKVYRRALLRELSPEASGLPQKSLLP
jgi:hypothetical protein